MAESKIFVGGLSWETTQEALRAYFEGFGEVTDATVKTDADTGKSRGFGFVSFADASSVNSVMSTDTHMLDNRKIDPKVAKARGAGGPRGAEPTLKVFVGGVGPEITEEEIRSHFSQFGSVDEVDLPFDKIKQERRAFVFVKFHSEDAVNGAVSNSTQTLGNSEIHVKKATPKRDQQDGGFGGGRGGGGGYGGGRGGSRGRGGYGSSGGYGSQGSYGAQGGYGASSYGAQGGYGASTYGGSGGYGAGAQGSYGSGNGYGSGYGAGDSYGASSAGYGSQQPQSRSYHPYQR